MKKSCILKVESAQLENASTELHRMSATKFCSSCGETINRNRRSFFGLAGFCPRCQKRSRANSFALFVLLGSCLLTGFFIGRLTALRQPFTFIGTPIDLQITRDSLPNERNAPSADHSRNQPTNAGEPLQSVAAETPRACGAPTKSGHPCRRKVRGGGYCWQHKDKAQPPASTAQPSQTDATHTPQ